MLNIKRKSTNHHLMILESAEKNGYGVIAAITYNIGQILGRWRWNTQRHLESTIL